MSRVLFHPGADEDYAEGHAWYAARSSRAAERFTTAVEQGLREIDEAPQQWPRVDEIHRYRRLKRYPYRIVYRIVGDALLIEAVAHGSRRAGYWRSR